MHRRVKKDDETARPKAASKSARLTVERSERRVKAVCEGEWNFAHIGDVDAAMRALGDDPGASMHIDTGKVSLLDTSGAWLIERLRRSCEARGIPFHHEDGDKSHIDLVAVFHPDDETEGGADASAAQRFNPVEQLGHFSVGLWQDFLGICNIIGAAVRGNRLKAGMRGGLRPISVINQIDHMGVRAIPVIAVMSFLIGAIIAQQGAFQLKWYGEELLTVNLVGILLLREIGVLLTAVMVAGRTGSAITAELGSMKMREEIDALRVIGLNPVGILIFPRLLALVICMPILTLLANASGLFGAMVVSMLYVGIPPAQFMSALQTAIDLSTLFAGLIKAPFMALIIGLVAAVEGMKVGGSTESLGQRVTSSVVRSIFAVILLDGLFAIFYASIGY